MRIHKTEPSEQRHQRYKDLALYVAISAIVIAFVLACTVEGLSFGWVILPPQTAFVFGYFIAVNRRNWNRSFWILTAVCFLIHLAVVPAIFIYMQSRVTHGMAIWLSAGTCLEALTLFLIQDLTLQRRKNSLVKK